MHMLPHVVLQNAVSLDGRNVGFPVDQGLYYEVAYRSQVDAHLAGSNTIIDPNEEIPPEGPEAFEPFSQEPDDRRPLLVVPDSRGRVRSWHALRTWPYWRGMVALCSQATPADYLDYLAARHVETIIAGEDHVDMRAALEELNARFGVEHVLLDSGGTLNGVMLRAGLVNEVSVLVHACLVGGTTLRSFFRAPECASEEGIIKLELVDWERLRGGVVSLRYNVVNEARTGAT
jgi:2,5-diamino-6-(ribosylamino)-4(3H)-pyrimidinone 5'-phosphate reductase